MANIQLSEKESSDQIRLLVGDLVRFMEARPVHPFCHVAALLISAAKVGQTMGMTSGHPGMTRGEFREMAGDYFQLAKDMKLVPL